MSTRAPNLAAALLSSVMVLSISACTNDNPLFGEVRLGDPDAGEPGEPDTPAPFEGCRPDQCAIDKGCFDNGAANPDNPCEACLFVVDPAAWSANDAATCDDGDACTGGDACVAGQCAGAALDCNDNDPCTADACDGATGQCASSPLDGVACDDGDSCTLGDVCQQGQCQGAPAMDCDDDNPCTSDTCDLGVGCNHAPLDGAACDDGDACTLGDVCDQGACQAGAAPLGCDDGNVCTVDGCDPERGCVNQPIDHLCQDDNPCTDERCDAERGCLYPFNDDPCDDLDACTLSDQCRGGACLGEAVALDDGNPCTDLSCDPVAGVQVGFNDDSCDDRNACTVGDLCVEGGCEAGTDPLNCDDGNTCTDDACDPDLGCASVNNTRGCDDNNACTIQDTCGDGRCAGVVRSCDDNNACTDDACDPALGCRNTPVVSNTCRPSIDVEFPPRAATIQGDSPIVTVRGRASSGAGAITALTINGAPAPVRAGAFSLAVPVEVGGNTLVIEATDAIGAVRRKVQSFLWSPIFRQPGPEIIAAGAVEEGLGMFLDREVLDDGDRTLPANDFATIFDIILDTFDIGSFIPDPAGTFAGLTIRVTSFDHGDPQVSLIPEEGVLHLRIFIPDIRAGMRAGSFNGSLEADSLVIDADVALDVQDRQLVVLIEDEGVQVAINNARFRFTSFILQLLIGWLVDAFLPSLINDLEAQFRGALADSIKPLLEDALGGLALDTTLDFPSLSDPGQSIPVRLRTAYAAIGIDPDGMALAFEAGAFAARAVPYDNLGALGRAGCLDGAQSLLIPGEGGFEMILSDDLLGQLLHGAWRGGLLEFDLPPELLGGLDLGQFGVSDLTMTLSGMLQPTASDCNPQGRLLLHIGDLRIDASMQVFGAPLDVVVFASFTAGLDLRAQEGGIGLAVESIESADLEINVVQDDLISFEAVLGELIEASLIPALLELLGGDGLGSFPLPSIDLSEAIDGLNEPLIITIVPRTLQRQGGNTIVRGELQ